VRFIEDYEPEDIVRVWSGYDELSEVEEFDNCFHLNRLILMFFVADSKIPSIRGFFELTGTGNLTTRLLDPRY
jgi:hypothetical protein